MNILLKLVDAQNTKTIAYKKRAKRMKLFEDFFEENFKNATNVKILDVGGLQKFWDSLNFNGIFKSEITLLNLKAEKITSDKFISIAGNGTKLEFKDNEFDIVFSNSVIEHVGDFENQLKMANEVKRVGKKIFIQTPNKYFPIEPHFLTPFIQLMPLHVSAFLLRHFHLGYHKEDMTKERSLQIIKNVRLISFSEIKKMFPNYNIYKEKMFGLTKSFIIFG